MVRGLGLGRVGWAEKERYPGIPRQKKNDDKGGGSEKERYPGIPRQKKNDDKGGVLSVWLLTRIATFSPHEQACRELCPLAPFS